MATSVIGRSAGNARTMQEDQTEGSKQWLRLALAAEEKLAGLHRSQRARAVEDLAQANAVSPNTIRRSLAALKFARLEGDRYGVSLDAVRAPISTIETLVRMARVSPADAGVYARSALLGMTPYQSLRAHCENLEDIAREDARKPRRGPCDVSLLAAEIGKELSTLGDYCIRNDQSQFARLVTADLEFSPRIAAPTRQNIVAFFGPGLGSCGRAAGDEVVVPLMAASLAFMRVYYIVSEQAHWSGLKEMLRKTALDFRRVKCLRLSD